jgi:hypothetical protein
VRGPRPGEFPELFPGADKGDAQRASEQSVGEQSARKLDGAGEGGAKSLLAMIGPHDAVTKLQHERGGVAYRQLMELCTKLFDGSIPAFPPNTKEQFDSWSKVMTTYMILLI